MSQQPIEVLAELVEPIAAKLEQARTDYELSMKETAEKRTLVRQLEKAYSYLTGEPAPGKPAPGPNGKRKLASAETKEIVRKAFTKLKPGEDITVRELAEVLPLNNSTIRFAIESLREDEEVRQTGKRLSRGQKQGTRPAAYALYD